MAEPDQLPTWATGGGADISTPTSGQQATGWVEGQSPPAGWFNWWQNLVYLWIAWYYIYILPASTIGFPYKSGDPIALRQDISPAIGGYVQYAGSGTPEYDPAVPRCVQSSSATDPVLMTMPFSQVSNTGISGSYIRIKRLSMLYSRATAGTVVKLQMLRAPRDGTGSNTVVIQLTGTSTAGTFVEMTSAADIDHDIDPAYVYWFQIELDPDVAKTDARIAFAWYSYTKTRVE